MKQIGIWLDKREALGLILENNKEREFSISSELDFFNPKGGSRSKTRWGPQDVVQDSKYLETEKHQLKRYFDNIVDTLGDVDELAIFGPAEAPDKFIKALEEDYPTLAAKVQTKQKVDSMTKNQFKALVKEFFKFGNQYF
ncbi:hypothetical protein GTQ34_10875 [Muricauda sp. JGD-17]|uniref:Uncharacterized protein n=1 Tax=Flagellimonas ochracea TaxID=2696472 RepID=A0A964WY41_9FLAO|nr:hypothetical protein [Allomuricauda ochracea]NAY92423.1 hypothetical protein [Allomuricauda ochracea]